MMNDLLAILPLLVVIGSALVLVAGRPAHSGWKKVADRTADSL